MPHPRTEPARIRTGADRAAADGWRLLAGRRLGIVTNPTGLLTDTLGSIVDAMAGAGLEVAAVYGPEHGFGGTAPAGGSEPTTVDPRTGITVRDAYGADADRFAGWFAERGIDTVVYDLQDVGARFYTYVWTLLEAMTAAARAGVGFVVLDRPNPVGGRARGPLLHPGYVSPVGGERIVQAHGLTAGELAGLFDAVVLPARAGRRLRALEVVELEGWTGDLLWVDTGLVWVPPSPNLPTPDSALLYPGTGLFEGTTLSEGRGTTRPFALLGAPWVDHRWAAALEGLRLPGLRFRETAFLPAASKHAGELCRGVQIHPTDPHAVDAVALGVHLLASLRDLYPEFGWRPEPDGGRPWIDLLTGSDRLRRALDAGASAETIIGGWADETADFVRTRAPYLRYPRGAG
ncbi:uncharacterized protein YbbC (DUF1343 family) [Friedmanniella endophytica]|uniref:Uncharacterized protein YbbC (DUF1343 family) n=1 Tax=Microlunatus kandeliicorticis TaxID=1759536 RepID=A0A7W3ISL6_9ACTN|nr:DUF1343 domain-containing protein [Microlunatus kandeliicorticis]MBA8794501.1 uncharacterized protein YbbC (DUF1343 family) [Microlunatus kandeliicorticis]